MKQFLKIFVCTLSVLVFNAVLAQGVSPPIAKALVEQRIQLLVPLGNDSANQPIDFQKRIQDAMTLKHPVKSSNVDCVRYTLGVSDYRPSQAQLVDRILPRKFTIVASKADDPPKDPQDPQEPVGTNTCKRTKCTKTCDDKGKNCSSSCEYICTGTPMAPGIVDNNPSVPNFQLPVNSGSVICPRTTGF